MNGRRSMQSTIIEACLDRGEKIAIVRARGIVVAKKVSDDLIEVEFRPFPYSTRSEMRVIAWNECRDLPYF